MERTKKITFEFDGKNVEASHGQTVLDAVLAAKIDLDHSCGGFGSCTTCRIFVQEPERLPPRNEIEKEAADDRGFSDEERLACQLTCMSGLKIRKPN